MQTVLYCLLLAILTLKHVGLFTFKCVKLGGVGYTQVLTLYMFIQIIL